MDMERRYQLGLETLHVMHVSMHDIFMLVIAWLTGQIPLVQMELNESCILMN